ncbi:MAG TPA: RICIN domain-containing protein [Candidatus Limnocylindrales bacterium]|nr:RICIN domain-containing protein [Candidatus Limnocylindrales bacterium]
MSRGTRWITLVLGVAAALAPVAMAGPAQAASFKQIPNYGNRKCLDVAAENNHYVQLWQCFGNQQQAWLETLVDPANNRWTFTNQRTGQCLAVEGNAVTAQAAIIVDWCGTASATWHILYAYNAGSGWHQQLQNVNSGLCLDLQWNSSANGTPIWLWPCSDELHPLDNNPAQLWMM